MTRHFRVLHIAPGEPFGGVQRIVLNLAEQQAGAHCVGIVWTGGAGRALAQMPHDGIRAMNAAGSPLVRIVQTRRMLRSFRPDIVHFHMPPPWVALAMDRTPACYHLHGPPSTGRGLASWLDSTIIGRADRLIAISDWIANAWRGVYPEATYRVVFNGIPPGTRTAAIRPPGAAGFPVIGFASRLADDKGVDEFADFALALHAKMPSARFLVAGEGPERQLLERKLAGLIDSNHVELLGHQTDMAGFWSLLDLAIFSAPGEPFGLRLIEPVAEGVPVLAYETGAGSDEIARNCAAIASVPYRDSAAMADLAIALLSDPDKRSAMVRDGMRDLESKFSIAQMAAAIDGIYAEIAEPGEDAGA